MKLLPTDIPGVLLLEPRVFRDARGRFAETWRADRYAEAGIPGPFVQDNVSVSGRGVLRGLHFQRPPHEQGKLVTCLEGEVYDVAVDIRAGSPTFGRWTGTTLSSETSRQIFIPPGFAHGFVVTSERAIVSYKVTSLYAPEAEGGILWSDPDLGIRWPVVTPVLSAKDAAYPRLREIAREALPKFRT